MNKALFVGISAAFFIAYSLAANALGVGGNDEIGPLTVPTVQESQTESGDPRLDIPVLGPIVKFVVSGIEAVDAATNIFTGFFQLITFQAPGLEQASLITLLIFVPLAFANGFIVFSAIRGSS